MRTLEGPLCLFSAPGFDLWPEAPGGAMTVLQELLPAEAKGKTGCGQPLAFW